MSGQPSIGYYLYLYRQQLARRKVPILKLYTVKHRLTNGIVAYTWNNIAHYDTDEFGNLMDIIVYNEKLQYTIEEKLAKKYNKHGEQVTFL